MLEPYMQMGYLYTSARGILAIFRPEGGLEVPEGRKMSQEPKG